MGYSRDKRARARAAYIHDNLPAEQIARMLGVSEPTVRRWKRLAKDKGDDWDKARGASLLAGSGIEDVARQMLAEFVMRYQTLTDGVLNNSEMSMQDKVSALASLADTFNKVVAASRRVLPETNELAVALQTLTMLGDFVRDSYPKHAGALLEVLEPFGEVVSQRFGQ